MPRRPTAYSHPRSIRENSDLVMAYTRGFHPRRKVRLHNVLRWSRGCYAGSWRAGIRLTIAAGDYLDRQPDDRLMFELDSLVESQSDTLEHMNWNVPVDLVVHSQSRHFEIQTRCHSTRRLSTLIDRRYS